MVSIKINSELSHPLLFRFAQAGAAVEVSPDFDGFLITMTGQDDISGTERRDFMAALREVRKAL